MGRSDDPDLAPDAALAEDLGDEEARREKQLEYFGGEKDDDIDNFDPTGLDDGSDPDFVPPDKEEDPKADEEDEPADDPAEADGDNDSADEDSDGVDDDDSADKVDDDDDGSPADSAEDEDDDSAEADPEPAPKGIPKRRFDEVNERRKAAEAERDALLAEKNAGKEAEVEAYDFDAAEAEYIDLVLDGKTTEALDKRKEIRAAEKADFQAETKAEVHDETYQRETAATLNALSKEAEQMFPVFDRESDEFDPAITKKVMVYYNGYLDTGEETPDDAFVLALADVIEQYGLDVEGDPQLGYEDTQDGKAEPKPAGKKKDTAKKLEAAKQAHKPVAGEGAASDSHGAVAPNIEDMTDEELDALPEKTLARMRGDFID
jgi:hypothetical protein